jgi:hypothetical protein
LCDFSRYQAARRFNRDVFLRLRECIGAPSSPSQFGGRGYNATGVDSTCTAAEMTVVVLGNHNFGGAHEGRVSGENIWYVALGNNTAMLTFAYLPQGEIRHTHL